MIEQKEGSKVLKAWNRATYAHTSSVFLFDRMDYLRDPSWRVDGQASESHIGRLWQLLTDALSNLRVQARVGQVFENGCERVDEDIENHLSSQVNADVNFC